MKNIIFDMDGVLVDSENAIRTACIEMFKGYGVSAVPEDFLPFTGMGENSFIGGVARKYGLEFIAPMKDEAYRIYGEKCAELIFVFPGVPELIRKLKSSGRKVAVASAADMVKVEVNLRHMGFSPADFDALVTGSDVTKHKPNPEAFLTAAARIGAKPRECVVIEDAVAGCQAAKTAGMHCIGVTTSFSADELKTAGAELIAQNTADIITMLEKL